MADFGYDVADYRDVDPIFGSLRRFRRAGRPRPCAGLRVIIDQVYAHSSDQHAWFRESRADPQCQADWYVWADARVDGTPPNNWQPCSQARPGPGTRGRRQYYMHNFPEHPAATQRASAGGAEALLDTARFWLDRGVRGFRLDAITCAMLTGTCATIRPPGPEAPRTRAFDFQRNIHNPAPPHLRRPRTAPCADRRIWRALHRREVGGAAPERRDGHAITGPQTTAQPAYGFNFLYADRLTPDLVRAAAEQCPRTGHGLAEWAFENHDAPRAVSRCVARNNRPEYRGAFAAMKMLLWCRCAAISSSIRRRTRPDAGRFPFERLKNPEAIANWPLTLWPRRRPHADAWIADAPFLGFSEVAPWLPTAPTMRRWRSTDRRPIPARCSSLTRKLLACARRMRRCTSAICAMIEASETLPLSNASRPASVCCACSTSAMRHTPGAPKSPAWHIIAQVGEIADGRSAPMRHVSPLIR